MYGGFGREGDPKRTNRSVRKPRHCSEKRLASLALAPLLAANFDP